MRNKRFFRPFSFIPKQLTYEREIVEKKYNNIEESILEKRSIKKLPSLLAQIRALAMNKEVLEHYAKSLKTIDIRLLAYEYPYNKETEETLEKVAQILIYGYTRDVGRTVWNLFQNSPEDRHIHRLLTHVFKVEDVSFLGLSNHTRLQLNNATKEGGSILTNLASQMVQSTMKAVSLLSTWKITEESLLEHLLLKEMLKNGLHNNHIINREGVEKISSYLEQYTLEEFKDMITPYISNRNHEEFHRQLIEQAVDLLGDPRKHEQDWSFLHRDSVQQVIRWLLQNELKHFFEQDHNNERFLYWKKFIHYLNDIHIVEEPSIISMDFGPFVVVEFGNIGAAYFYHREGFYELILPRVKSSKFRRTRSNQTRENMFKEKDKPVFQGIPLYINRLPHLGYWAPKFDRHMTQYLNGNFDYIGY